MQVKYTKLGVECQVTIPTTKIETWIERRRRTDRIADLYDQTEHLFEYAAKLRGCSNTLLFRSYEGGEKEVAHTLFCRSRLCPLCAWRRSLKAYNQLSKIMDYTDAQRAQKYKTGYDYLLITLTMRNCDPMDLPETIDHMIESFRRLYKTSEWSAAIKGAHRTLEVTYNDQDNTFHPHLHIICAVNPSYFTSAAYISQDKLRWLWQRSLQAGYSPIVHIAKITGSGEDRKDLHEVTKYVTKDADWSNLPDSTAVSVLSCLHGALHGRKLYAQYGVIRDAARSLRMSDEDGDLLNVAENDEQLMREIRADLRYAIKAYTRTWDGYEEVNPEVLPHNWQLAYINLLDEPHQDLTIEEKIPEYKVPETPEFYPIEAEEQLTM